MTAYLSKFAKALLVVLLLVLLPAVLMAKVGGGTAVGGFIAGLFPGIIAATGHGRRLAMTLLPSTVIMAALGAWTFSLGESNGNWIWWIGLLAICGGLIGFNIHRGIAVPLCEVGIVAAATGGFESGRDIAIYAGFAGVGLLWGVLLARLAGAPEVVELVPRDVSPAIAATVVAIGMAVAGALAPHFVYKPYWIPMTFLTVFEVWVGEESRTTRAKVIGRITGSIVALAVLAPLVSKLPPAAAIIAALLMITGALVVSDGRYWLTCAMISAGIVVITELRNCDPSTAGSCEAALSQVGGERVTAQIVAGLLLVAVASVGVWLEGKRRAARDLQSA